MTLAAPQQLLTRPGTLAEARHVILPAGIVASGFPQVRETCRQIGISFDDWQSGLNRCILAKAADGLYAADTVVLSIPRQVGKTYDIGAIVFGICVANPGTTVVWTAHRFKVARETFTMLRSLANSSLLKTHLDYDEITTAAGNESIPFRNGSRIVFAARERGAIRGFTKVRILVLDEAQILTEAGLADLAPTMNQAANPLIIMMGTPPKPNDPGEVFTNLREAALSGEAEGVLYVEFSAEEGSDPDSREAWRQANPSYPERTPERAILRMRKLLAEDDFRREALGIWDSNALRSAIPVQTWRRQADSRSRIAGPPVFAVEVALDRSMAAIAVAGRRADGLLHGELVRYGKGSAWVQDELVRLSEKHNSTVVIDGVSPAASMIPSLKDAGVSLNVTTSADMSRACGVFFDAVTESQFFHLGDPQVEVALLAAGKRSLAGGWAWDRRHADISPLVAVTLAAYGVSLFGDDDGGVTLW